MKGGALGNTAEVTETIRVSLCQRCHIHHNPVKLTHFKWMPLIVHKLFINMEKEMATHSTILA